MRHIIQIRIRLYADGCWNFLMHCCSKNHSLLLRKYFILKIVSVTLFRDPTVAILTLKMQTESCRWSWKVMSHAACDPDRPYRKPPVILKSHIENRQWSWKVISKAACDKVNFGAFLIPWGRMPETINPSESVNFEEGLSNLFRLEFWRRKLKSL